MNDFAKGYISGIATMLVSGLAVYAIFSFSPPPPPDGESLVIEYTNPAPI